MDNWAHHTLEYLISLAPSGSVAIGLDISLALYEALVETPALDVTLNGADVNVQRMYEREFPERLTWYETDNGPGWHLSRDVIEHQRELKRERGIRAYRGIPITVVGDGQCRAHYESIEVLLAGRVLTGTT